MPFGGNDPARIGGLSPPGDALIAFALPQSGSSSPNVVTAHPVQVNLGNIPDANLSDPKPQPSPGSRVIDVVAQEQNYEPNNFVVMSGEKISLHLIVPGSVAGSGAVGSSIAVALPSGPFGLRGIIMPGNSTYFDFTAPSEPGLTSTSARFGIKKRSESTAIFVWRRRVRQTLCRVLLPGGS